MTNLLKFMLKNIKITPRLKNDILITALGDWTVSVNDLKEMLNTIKK